MRQTPEDIKAKKAAKKEKKAAKLAAKAAGIKGKKHGHDASRTTTPVPPNAAPFAAPPAPVDNAPQATGAEATEEGGVTQRPPRATVEEVQEE